MSSKTKFNIFEYYDEIIKKIDIQTETLLSTESSEENKNDLNTKRETLINKIKSTRNSTLTKLETTDDLNQLISNETKFLFYLQNETVSGKNLRSKKPAKASQPELKIGKLVEANKYISQDILTELNVLNDNWQKGVSVKLLNLDTTKLQAMLILSYIHLFESEEIISIDYNLSKIESLCFNSGQNLFAEKFKFLKFSQMRSIDLTGLDNIKKLVIYDQAIKKVDLISSSSLKELDLSSNKIDRLDKNAFLQCPNLTHLNLSGNGLTFKKESFNGLNYLEDLDLRHNSIKELDDEVFSHLVNLKKLNLAANEIELIGEFDLNGLEKLETLHLECNSIEAIDQKAFEKLSNLTYLNLVSNQLTLIDFILPNIKDLSLDKNSFESIDLSRYPTLDTLSLNHNSVDSLSLKGLKKLKTLSLITNGLEELRDDLFEDNQNLVELRLSFNELRALNGALRNLKCLEKLNLWSNEIVDLTGCFQGLTNLKLLHLEDNKIEKINKDDFKDLINLVELDLKGNLIGEIADEAFNNLTSLQTLNLAKNKIKSIKCLESVKDIIKNLDLSNNPLDN